LTRLVDYWTIANIVIFVVELIGARFAFRSKKEGRETDGEENAN